MKLLKYIILFVSVSVFATEYTPTDSTSLQTALNSVVAGDIITINTDIKGTFTMTNRDGTSENQIIIRSTNGSGIVGTESVGTFTNTSGDIWETSFSGNVTQCFRADTLLTLARTPNISGRYVGINDTYEVTSVQDDQYEFTVNDLIGTDITGATIHINSPPWILRAKEILTFNAETGNLTIPEYEVRDKQWNYIRSDAHVFVNNHYSFLDTIGEWYYDDTAKKLFICSTSEPTNIKVTTVEGVGLFLSGENFLTIDGINVFGYDSTGIYSSVANNLIIKNCSIQYCNSGGIWAMDGDSTHIDNCYFIGSNHRAANIYDDNSYVKHSEFREIGIAENFNSRGFMHGSAIRLYGAFNNASYNEFYDVGYAGVEFWDTASVVEYNYIKDFMLTVHDGGGVYSFASTIAGSVINNNIIISNLYLQELGYDWQVAGIYFDTYTYGITAHDNTILNCRNSFVLNHNRSYEVYNNIIYNPYKAGIWAAVNPNDTIGNGRDSNFIHDNIIYLKDNRSVGIEYYCFPGTGVTEMKSNKFENNILYGEQTHGVISFYSSMINEQAYGFATNNSKKYLLADWQSIYGANLSDTDNDTLFETYKINTIIADSLIPNGFFDTDISGWGTTWNSTSAWIDGHLEATATANYSQIGVNEIFAPSFQELNAGSNYVLTFKAKSNISKTIWVRTRMRKDGTEYPYFMEEAIVLSDEWEDYQFHFTCERDGFLEFLMTMEVLGQTLYLDNVRLMEVTGEEAEYPKLVANTTLSDATYYSGYSGSIIGDIFSNGLIVEPFTSEIILNVIKNAPVNYTGFEIKKGNKVEYLFIHD